MAEGSVSLTELRDLKKDLEREKAFEERLLKQLEPFIWARSTGEINPRTNPSVAFDPITGGRRNTTNTWSMLGEDIERNSRAMAQKKAREMKLIEGLATIPRLVITGSDYIPCFKDIKDRGRWNGTIEISGALPQNIQMELFDELTDLEFNVAWYEVDEVLLSA